MKTILRQLTGYRLGQLEAYRPRPISLTPAAQAPAYKSPLKFSLVTPVRNQASFIGQTIESVIEQQFSPLEYIVMDGGSTDGTTDVIERYRSHLTHFESRNDEGQSDALNKGFAKASGDIFGWLNGDDLLLPGAIEYVARFFLSNPDVDVVYGDRIVINAHGDDVGRWMLPSHSDQILSWVDYIPQETLFWRRSLWERAGSYVDTSFSFAMDWELLVRFRDHGAHFRHLPHYIGAFRVHSFQKTSAEMDGVGIAEMNRIRTRCLGYVPSKAALRVAVTPYVLRHLARVWRSRVLRVVMRKDSSR
ncbi:glycosyltransferase family 2 protein [Bradyrhizobium iriomotense]|uniref:glycosyltransferase family 2 protein n=1 Tax=Bradyrhizobium iriomotense TaxID=441950 RepID=UPI001B8A5E2A|nr:glycosyltransferase family 2 protein [Bradyrhizobium iriomotense]MBR1133268.1 glycosyltransferase [Bradyrhizobium iriomotense]